jgi:ketosteroid isomerase-like protein
LAEIVPEDETASSGAPERERELWEAFRTKNAERLVALIHPDALDVGPSGILGRSSVLSAVSRMEIARYSIDGFTLRGFGDVEVVTYLSTVDGTYAGNPFPAPSVRVTTVWMRFADAWVVIHRHETPALPGSTNL